MEIKVSISIMLLLNLQQGCSDYRLGDIINHRVRSKGMSLESPMALQTRQYFTLPFKYKRTTNLGSKHQPNHEGGHHKLKNDKIHF